MAAGRFDVSRRRDFNNTGYSTRQFDQYRNLAAYRLNEHHTSLGARSSQFRRNGVSCGLEERGFCEMQGGSGLHMLEEGEIPRGEDEVRLPSEKKRKVSPIIWDIEDKETLKNRVVSTDLSRATDAVAADVGVPTGLQPAIGALGTPGSKSKSPVKDYGDDDQEQFQDVEEEEFTEARNVSRSRWASDDDSPMGVNFSGNERTVEQGTCGETASRGQGSADQLVGDRLNSSGSNAQDFSAGFFCGDEDSANELGEEDQMEVDGVQDENGDVSEIDDSCCYDGEPTSQRNVNMLEGCRSVNEYEKLHEISEGTYGKVYKALDKRTVKAVALKKVKMDVRDKNLEDYGFPLTSLREINTLLSLHHPSIVNVNEVVTNCSDGVFMVMEYMEHDLKGFMQSRKHPFSTSEVKCLMLQLLEGVKYLHDNWILHRDLKTSNLLLNNEGHLKICDFGMARRYGSPIKPYTSLVVTLWYRAPELLLGEKQYSTAIDMWSVGCIMAELLSKEPLFKGKTEIDQLGKIFGVLGTPNEKIWPGFSKLPGAKANFVKQPYNLLRKKFPAASFTGSPILSDLGLDLLNKLLAYDPEKRLTADEALSHAWFHEVPLPKSKEFMPTLPPQYAKSRSSEKSKG